MLKNLRRWLPRHVGMRESLGRTISISYLLHLSIIAIPCLILTNNKEIENERSLDPHVLDVALRCVNS